MPSNNFYSTIKKMGRNSANNIARQKNGCKGGRPSSKANPLIEELSNLLEEVDFNERYFTIFEDKDDDMIEIMDEIIEKIEENYFTIIETNNLEYELDICDQFNKLMIEVDVNNRLLFIYKLNT